MKDIYENKVGKLESPFCLNLTREAFAVYEYYNKTTLDSTCSLPYTFKNVIEKLDSLNNIKSKHVYYTLNHDFNQNSFEKKVLIGFTGSLDSIYQTINLKESGYEVKLFYLNYDTLLGRKRLFDVYKLAKKLKFELIVCNFKFYGKFNPENCFNNLLLYSLMLDCCQEYNIYYISSGDALNNFKNSNNLANLPEVTETFINELYLYIDFDFIPAEKTNKITKLKKLKEYDLLYSFNDCTNITKFMKINKNKLLTQYKISLPQNNCGLCYKCIFYNLLRHYYLNESFTPEYIDFCWKNIITETNYNLFNQNIPLALRIKNLLNY